LASFLKGKRLAIANPDRDPAGTRGLRWLREIGLTEEDDKNLVVAESAAGVVQVLTDGAAQLGIVYSTDAVVHSNLVALTMLPDSSERAIEYVGVEAIDPQSETKPFLEFVTSPEALVLLQAAGLQVARESPIRSQCTNGPGESHDNGNVGSAGDPRNQGHSSTCGAPHALGERC